MSKDWREIEGWLEGDEGEKLRELATGQRVLEMGSYQGRSTVAMAQVAKLVISVDTHHGDEHTGKADTFAAFIENLFSYEVAEKVVIRAGRFEDIVPTEEKGFDLVFLDGQHDKHSVIRDTKLALDAVRDGGIVAWHDYDDDYEVKAALNELGIFPDGTVRTLAWKIINEKA